MRRMSRVLFPLGIALVLSAPARAEIEMPQSVVGSGGGGMDSEDYVISGSTLGQTVIGIVSGPSNIHPIGFWHPAGMLTPVAEPEISPSSTYDLGQNYPNPFNPVTEIAFSVPEPCHVTIRLFDVNGRAAMTLVDEALDAGRHVRILQAEGLSSGVYFYRMVAGPFVETRKLVLLK